MTKYRTEPAGADSYSARNAERIKQLIEAKKDGWRTCFNCQFARCIPQQAYGNNTASPVYNCGVYNDTRQPSVVGEKCKCFLVVDDRLVSSSQERRCEACKECV